MLQRQPIQKLHGDERFAVCVINFVDGANVGMIQGRGRLGFALKAAEGLRIFGYVVGQELQGHEPAELHILSLVNDTHAAAAEFFKDAIVGDCPADERAGVRHVAQILDCQQGQVNVDT